MTKEELKQFVHMAKGDGHTVAKILAAEIERLQSEREWRYISTAPKDGTRILVFGSKMHGLAPIADPPPPEVYEVRWFKWYGDEPGWMLANCDEEYGHCIDATLWMPLPDSPEGCKE